MKSTHPSQLTHTQHLSLPPKLKTLYETLVNVLINDMCLTTSEYGVSCELPQSQFKVSQIGKGVSHGNRHSSQTKRNQEIELINYEFCSEELSTFTVQLSQIGKRVSHGNRYSSQTKPLLKKSRYRTKNYEFCSEEICFFNGPGFFTISSNL